MYRRDKDLELADMRLRLFVEYCQALPYLWDKANDISEKVAKCGFHSSSVIKVKGDKSHNKIEWLIDDEIKAWKRYNDRNRFVKATADILKTLDKRELELLYWRYEQKLTLRELGKLYNYSYMNMSRYLDAILIKF